MGAFDRLQNYSSRGVASTTGVFDINTPRGAFLERVHSSGYKMFERFYSLKEEFQVSPTDYASMELDEMREYDSMLFMTESEFNAKISDADKHKFNEEIKYTELYNVITTAGNQQINAAAGSGKALVNGTKVLSSSGWLNIENLKVDDKVIGSDGKSYKVSGIFPQGKKPSMKINFSDGSFTLCSEDHLWSYYDPMYDITETLTAKDLVSKIIERPLYLPIHEDICISPLASCPVSIPIIALLIVCCTIENDNIYFPESDRDLVCLTLAMDASIDVVGIKPDIENKRYMLELSQSCIDELKEYNFINSDNKFDLSTYMVNRFTYDRLCFVDNIISLIGYKVPNTTDVIALKLSPSYSHWLNTFIEVLNSLGHIGVELKDNFLFLKTSCVHFSETMENLPVLEDEVCCSLVYPSKFITSIEYTGLEEECTCIAVDSPDHLFFAEGYNLTHNTSALIFKIMHDIVTGEAMTLKSIPGGQPVRVVNKMWVCTFLRTGASELEFALTNWQRKFGYSQVASQVVFSTLDAEFKRCLNAMGVETPIGDPDTLHSLLCKAIDSCNVTRRGYNLTKEDYQIIASIVVYYRGRLDNSKYKHPSCKDYDLTPTVLDLIVKQFDTLRKANKIMDFEEIMELLYKYLYVTPNPAVQEFVANRYNFMYIDEFQDTSQMAYAILKFYARGHLWINSGGTPSDEDVKCGLYTGHETIGKMVVVGDISQCIYSFRGSDSKILGELVDHDFVPTHSALSVNWRCPDKILNPVIPSIHVNEDSKNQRIVSANQGGEFYAYSFSSYKTMIKQLKEDLMKDMNDSMSVAILCRTNFDGMIPAFMLEAEGRFDFGISGSNMTMNSPLPRKIIGVASLFTERSTPAVKNTLSYFMPRGTEWQLKKLMDVLKVNNKSIWQIPEADINYSCPELVPTIRDIKKIFMPDGITRDKEKEIEALKFLYYKLIAETFSGDSAYCESARAYIETLLYLIENNNFKTVYEFLEEVELLNDKLSGRIKKNKAPIQIATVHEFKGKERDSIYVWNDSDGVFLSSKCDIDDDEQLAEERRVHYIACTRAKKREHIYTLKSKVGMFVKEMDLTLINPQSPSVSI